MYNPFEASPQRYLVTQNAPVTIVMATHNGSSYLSRQIQSILDQSYGEFLLLIGDDASTDGSREILKRFAESDSRIQLILRDRPLGFLKNFEDLLSRAPGEYIALSDQDDLWDRSKLEIQMHKMLHAKAAGKKRVLVHSDLELIDENDHKLSPSYFAKHHYRFPAHRDVALMLTQAGVMGNTVLMDRELLCRVIPFPQGLKYHDYWIGVIAELFGHRITIRQSLVSYRIHRRNVSGKSRWLSGEMKYPWRHRWLPYRDEGRYRPLRSLLAQVQGKDRKRVLYYLIYLRKTKYHIRLYPRMRRYGFFSGPLSIQVKLFMRVLIGTVLKEKLKY